jgi:glucuronate isomerase
VCEHRLDEDEAFAVAADLAYNLVKRAYKLDQTQDSKLALTA